MLIQNIFNTFSVRAPNNPNNPLDQCHLEDTGYPNPATTWSIQDTLLLQPRVYRIPYSYYNLENTGYPTPIQPGVYRIPYSYYNLEKLNHSEAMQKQLLNTIVLIIMKTNEGRRKRQDRVELCEEWLLEKYNYKPSLYTNTSWGRGNRGLGDHEINYVKLGEKL